MIDNDLITISNGSLKACISHIGAEVKQLWYEDMLIATRGITIGRYANRIAGGKFTLNGKEYQILTNENGNTLHGGPGGFAKRPWDVVETTENKAVLSIVSDDGDQGFPGKLALCVSFELEDDALRINYEASCDEDTVINFTNHMYFNLNGGGEAKDHMIMIDANFITESDSQLIPTGKLLPVEGTRFDLRKLADFVPSYDDNFVLNGSGRRDAALLVGKKSGLEMTVTTDQPAMQLYNTASEICLESQHYPDSPNHPEFPTTVLKAEDVFRTETIYSFRKRAE